MPARARPTESVPTGAWHAHGPEAVLARLGTGPHGLTRDEAARRLAEHGPNRLEEEPPTPAWVVWARQFRSPLIAILLVALVVTVLLGELVDAGVIAAVLVLNAVIGFTQERKAETAVRSLGRLVVSRARVLREGEEWEVEGTALVPGDLVLLESGQRVPADLRLVAVTALRIDQSLLTGESVPVGKSVEPTEPDAGLGDRDSMAHTGTVVASGRGVGVVVATGADTALGEIADLIRHEPDPETPLQERMGRFARVIGVAVGAAALLAFTSGVALGEPVGEMFLVAVAMAVSAVPEGLPVAVTITLAVGVSRMARRRAIIRRLAAVETLGSTTLIGSDKTGTLTENRMTVRAVWSAGREHHLDGGPLGPVDPRSPLGRTLIAGVLTNEAEIYHRDGELAATGDPTEVALLTAAAAVGLEPPELRLAHPTVDDVPFEPVHRRSATVREDGDEHLLVVKGAPEQVLERCEWVLTDEGIHLLDVDEAHRAAATLAAEGLRVLAVASRAAPADSGLLSAEEPAELVLLGFVGLVDPPRAGVREAIAACRRAGVRVVMITGDHVATARAIADDLGIGPHGGPVLTGHDLQDLDDDARREAVRRADVFARVSPEDKLRIVQSAQADGHVVAVTGDGVNDAPALKAAQIGVAMGRDGTDVAREAADMVLTDDDFVSITAAVEEGRVTFDNIRKVTFFLVSTGAAEVVAILVAVWSGWPLLFLPAQLLWLNLVTNGLQDVALAFEPEEPGVLDRPPRPPGEGVLSRVLWQRTLLAGVVMAIGTLVMFRWQLDAGGTEEEARSVALTTMVAFQVFQAGNARSERRSLLRIHPTSNRFLFLATVAAVGVHVAALHLAPTQYVLRVEPLPAGSWWRLAAVATTVLVAVELEKWLRRRAGHGRRE